MSKLISLAIGLLIVAASVLALHHFTRKNDILNVKTNIDTLVKRLDSEQSKEDTGFFPPFSFVENKGLYRSDVHINFFGGLFDRFLRNIFAVPDNNMFITNFVCLALIESYELGAIELPKEQLELAIKAITLFKDKNHNGSDLYTFWPQTKGSHLYEATPLNLVNGIDGVEDIVAVLNITMRTLGLSGAFNKYVKPVYDQLNIFATAFKIPSDSDDTSVNLALGSLIRKHKDILPEAYEAWSKTNQNLQSTLNAFLTYSYQPFAADLDRATIDSRSYYYLHEFLKKNQNKTNLTLINTWLTNISSELPSFPDVAMPFHTNNVDLTVNTNTLFGLVHTLIDFPELGTPEILNLVSSIVDLIEHCIETNLVLKRPDIVLLYYPSVYDFYWFVSRNLFYLEETEFKQGTLPFETLTISKERLGKLLRSVGTDQMLALMQENGEDVYWDDFLGMNDGSLAPNGEDRLFSTALAINFFFDVWMTPNRSSFIAGTPAKVLDALKKGVSFLNREIVGNKYKKLNAFFSGSIKGNTTFPFNYPFNFFQYIDGKAATPTDPNVNLLNITSGASGFLNNYEEMLNQTWFGRQVPREFSSYNNEAFPYWASPAMTDAITLLALAKYQKVSLELVV